MFRPDPVAPDLVRQLLVYKQFKQAAAWLKELEAQGRQSYIRLAGTPALERTADLSGVTLDDLLAAVRHVLNSRPPLTVPNGLVPAEIITVAEQVALIERELQTGQRVGFFRLLERSQSRLEIVVTLLALLEMVKQLRVTMRQDRLFGDIVIEQAGTMS